MADQRTPSTTSQDATHRAKQAADEAQQAADLACGCAETDADQKSDLTEQFPSSSPSSSSPTATTPLGAQPLTGSTPTVGSQAFQGDASSEAHSSETALEKLSRQQHEMRSQADQLKSTARETGDEVRRKGAEMASEAKYRAQEMKDRAMHAAAETAEKAQQQASDFAQEQKSRIASELQSFSKAVSSAADKLREDHDDRIASYADLCADQLRSTASYLQTRTVGELMGDLENLARRRPEIFFGGMLLAGLGIARFLKASNRPRRQRYREPYETPDWGGERNLADYNAPAEPGSTEAYRVGAGSAYNAGPSPQHDRAFDDRPLEAATNTPVPSSSQSSSKDQPMNDPLSYH